MILKTMFLKKKKKKLVKQNTRWEQSSDSKNKQQF